MFSSRGRQLHKGGFERRVGRAAEQQDGVMRGRGSRTSALQGGKEMPGGTTMGRSPRAPEEVLVGNGGRLLGERNGWTEGSMEERSVGGREGGMDKGTEGPWDGWNACWMRGWMQIQVDGGMARKIGFLPQRAVCLHGHLWGWP